VVGPSLNHGPTTLGLMRGSGADLRGRLLLQMGTIAPSESHTLRRWLADQGCHYTEKVPVLGSKPEALSGRLLVMTADLNIAK